MMSVHQFKRAASQRDYSAHQPLPCNIEAEQSLIGAVLINNDAYNAVLRRLPGFGADSFHEAVHAKIWENIEDVISAGRLASPIILKTYLGNEDIGGVTPFEYMVSLSTRATTVSNAPEYAQIVYDCALRRQVIATADTVREMAYNASPEMSGVSLWADMEARIEANRPKALLRAQTGFIEFGSIRPQSVYDAYQRGGENRLVGFSSGLPRLDEVLGGLRDTDLIVLGGRPGSGKTALASGVLVNVAKQIQQQGGGGVAGFFSLEMSEQQLKVRACCAEANVPYFRIDRGIATKEEMERFHDAERGFDNLPLAIDPTSPLTLQELSIRARHLKKRRGLRFLGIDYLQKLSSPTSRYDNRSEEVRRIAEGLKNLAKELQIPILALAQLGRDVENRDDKRPRVSDLKESGAIEQEADGILLIHRPEVYVKKWKPAAPGNERFAHWEREMRKVRGIAELIIGKNRHGPDGVVELGFEGRAIRFVNDPAPREPDPEPEPERRKKAKALRKEAIALSGVLANLTLWQKGRIATKEDLEMSPALRKGAYLLPLDIVRNAFQDDFAGVIPPEKLEDEFRAAFKELHALSMAQVWKRSETEIYMWRPDVIGD